MQNNSDWNLLVGLLAWQNGLVTPAELQKSIEQWSESQDLTIGELMVASGAIDDKDLQLLLPLVDAYVLKNANDPTLSLERIGAQLSGAAVSMLSTLKKSVQNEAISKSLDLTTLASYADRSNATSASEATFSARHKALRSGELERFRILRPHAKGGLGEVYVASDDSLNRKVAIKEIQEQFSDNVESRERFILEAEVTGGLEHPGIVPVYALGQYDDGRPYYAMRFIQGDSLKEAITEFHSEVVNDESSKRLRLRELLGRFVDVCQSISYAHSRGVLHRDLKPGNIMLGTYGETLVVDWGLARLTHGEQDNGGGDDSVTNEPIHPASGSGMAPTMMGNAIGTPSYMPPEQAAGDIEQIGPASDVYSLGATLYHILTGQPPFVAKSVVKILERTTCGDFPPPRTISPSIPKQLEAICLKAMELRPDDRYSTPTGLAQDIERFLADEPVDAFHDPWYARLRRWTRKHQTLAVATASCIVLAVLGLATFSTIVGQKNSQLVKLNDDLDGKNAQLAGLIVDEKAARTQAESNEQLAKRQSELALSTLASVITDLQFELANLRGSATLRQRILETSLSKLNEVSTTFVQQASVDYETANALLEMGAAVQQTVAPSDTQGEASESAIATAATFLNRAYEITTNLSEQYPNDPQVYGLYSRACYLTGQLFAQQGIYPQAIERYRQGLPDSGGEDWLSQYNTRLSRLHAGIGSAQLSLGNLSEALASYKTSLNLVEQGLENQTAFPSDKIQTLGSIAIVLSRQGDVPGATGRLEEAVELARAMATESPNDPFTKMTLASTLNLLADIYKDVGDDGRSMLALSEALAAYRQLHGDTPDDVDAAIGLAATLDRMGYNHYRNGRAEDAIPLHEEALAIWKQLQKQSPEATNIRSAIAESLMQIGDSLAQIGDVEGTRARYQALLDTYQPLSEDVPDDADVQRGLATAYERIAMLHEYEGELDLAESEYRKMLAIKQKLFDASPNDLLAMHELAITHRHIGDVLELKMKPDAALVAFEQERDLSRSLIAIDPDKPAHWIQLVSALSSVGDSHVVMRNFDRALDAYSEATNTCRKMIENKLAIGQARGELESLEESLFAAENGELATGPMAAILNESRERQSKLLLVRAIIATRSGDGQTMIESAQQLQSLPEPTPEELYNAGAFSALICQRVAELDDDERAKFATSAISLIDQAIESGLDSPSQIQFDNDLIYLWDMPEFSALVEKASKLDN
ncbi:MAG TPA: hypothetical protein DDW52_17865 [Planctomycetaceae bacterium]|nr:hypothetical protein [Planctomycetaceae bacterium]